MNSRSNIWLFCSRHSEERSGSTGDDLSGVGRTQTSVCCSISVFLLCLWGEIRRQASIFLHLQEQRLFFVIHTPGQGSLTAGRSASGGRGTAEHAAAL